MTNEAMSPAPVIIQGVWGLEEGGQPAIIVSERSHPLRILQIPPLSARHHDGVSLGIWRKRNERSHSAATMNASRHGIMSQHDRLTSNHDPSGLAVWSADSPGPSSPDDSATCLLSVQSQRSCAWSHASFDFRASTSRTDGCVPVMAPLTPPSTSSQGFARRPGRGGDEEIESLGNISRIGIEIALQAWDPIMSNGREPGNLATSQASQVTPGPWSPTLEHARPLHRDDGRP
jgi:hypothetical protein